MTTEVEQEASTVGQRNWTQVSTAGHSDATSARAVRGASGRPARASGLLQGEAELSKAGIELGAGDAQSRRGPGLVALSALKGHENGALLDLG